MRHLFHQWRQLAVWYVLHTNGHVTIMRVATLNGQKYIPSIDERASITQDLKAYHRDNI